jgi:hypothetical protein
MRQVTARPRATRFTSSVKKSRNGVLRTRRDE